MRLPYRPMRIHKSITEDRVIGAAMRRLHSLDNPGFCLHCGEDHEGCKPDMEKGVCENCGENAVYGAEQIILLGNYHASKETK